MTETLALRESVTWLIAYGTDLVDVEFDSKCTVDIVLSQHDFF